MPANGDKLPKLYNSTPNHTSHPLGHDVLTHRDSLSRQSLEGVPTLQLRSKGRFGHRRIDVNSRPLGSKQSLSTNCVSLSESMEGNAEERNWDSEGGRPKSPQRQPIPRQPKKTGFRRLLQRPSFDGLMPFQRAPRDGSYEKSIPVGKTRNGKPQEDVIRLSREQTLDGNQAQRLEESDENEYQELTTPRQTKSKVPPKASKIQDSKYPKYRSSNLGAKKQQSNAKSVSRNNVPAHPRQENKTRQGSPTFTRLLRRKSSQDKNKASLENNPNTSSIESPPLPLPLSMNSSTSIDNDRGPNIDNSGPSVSEFPWERTAADNRNGNESIVGLSSPRDSDDPLSLPTHPPVPPRRLPGGSTYFSSARDGLPLNQSPRPGSSLIDLSPREDASTTSSRHSLNNDTSTSSPRDLYSTLSDNPQRNSSPVPPPRTSASLSARDALLNQTRDTQQPNSVFRQQPFRRQSSTESQDPPRQRANSEQSRISSPRFRNLLSRRGSSSNSRETSNGNSQRTDNESRGSERQGSSRSFWRNSFFGRLGSAERRPRSRSESATSSQSNSSQSNSSQGNQTSTQQSPAGTDNSDADLLGLPFGQRPMGRDRGRGFNRNDSPTTDSTRARIVRLTLGPSGPDIGRILSASQNGGSTGATNDDDLGIQIALIGSPMLSPPVDLTTIPPRLLLSFLLQGRRELGNEFVELVLENLLLSILARHMMEVGGQVGGGGAHPPATQDMIDKLEGFVIEQQHVDDDLNCAICHVEYELTEKLSKLPCKHFFHPVCISIWLKKSATCPVCRFKLTRPSETPTDSAAQS